MTGSTTIKALTVATALILSAGSSLSNPAYKCWTDKEIENKAHEEGGILHFLGAHLYLEVNRQWYEDRGCWVRLDAPPIGATSWAAMADSHDSALANAEASIERSRFLSLITFGLVAIWLCLRVLRRLG
jgi:hypothetical protein